MFRTFGESNASYSAHVVCVCQMLFIYRTGRWRTEYIIDLQQPQVKGSIKVDVHYFEAGNVSNVVTDNRLSAADGGASSAFRFD